MLIDDNLKKAWKRDGKQKLTPIRKCEAKLYKVATSIRLSRNEVQKIVRESIPSIMMTIIIFGIIMADWIFTEILEAFQDHVKFGLSFPGMEQGISFGFLSEGKQANMSIQSSFQ